jgi:methyl-accepting chemotaxis protein
MKSIQTKLTVSMLVIFCLALGILGGLNYWKARQLLTDSIIESISARVVDSGGEIGLWLEGRKSELTIMANAPVILSGSMDAIVPFITAAAKANKAYDGISYADLSGTYISSAGVKGNVADRDYFQRALRGEVAISDPLVSKSTGNLVTVVAIPVKADGKVIAVLYGAVSMEDVTKRVLTIKVGQTGYAYVIQGDGLTIIHPDKEMVMKLNTLKDDAVDPRQKEAVARMVKGEKGLAQYEFQGVNKYIAFAPIPGVNWSLAITVPVSEATGAVSALTVISLVTIVIILAVAAGFISWYARRIARPIREIEAVADRIADGDITTRQLGISSNDEIGRLGQSIERMTDNLRRLVQQILSVTEQVAASSEELTANADQSAQAASQVATSITETSQGADRQSAKVAEAVRVVEQISAGTRKESANTVHAVEIVKQAVAAATEGNLAVDTAVRQMNQIQVTVDDSAKVVSELGERSKEIGKIVETISSIAGQTNLLALNAAIEAARAGEQGRGFAVVAEEVRKLAENSQDAAKQIEALIGDIQAKTETAVEAMNNGTKEVKKGTEVVDRAGVAFGNIMSQVNEVAAISQGVSDGLSVLTASSGQVLGAVKEVEEISREIARQSENISASTEEQSASMEEIASSSQALAKLAEDLQQAVRRFKI